ncbi:elongation factor 1-alpha C-terminal domain-related protein, partial [Corynebacterium stationis]|uniref:elongation factor 1-alpha C-terminal domain-related protein n=2 Tax=Corynebacterium stationis TaxID=1705 RepID=UPI003C6C0787
PAESAVNGDSVVLRLADDIDLARGDLISGAQRPEAVRSFEATVVALTEKDLKIGPMYKVRYGAKVVKGRITSIERVLDLDGVDFDVLEPEKIALNDIAHVSIEVAEELPVEDYAARGAVGNFLVTDSSTGNTLAAGLIGHRLR